MFGSFHLQLFVGGLVSYLRSLCLLAHSGVHHIMCCVFVLVFFPCVPYVASFSGCRFLITSTPSVFSNVYIHHSVHRNVHRNAQRKVYNSIHRNVHYHGQCNVNRSIHRTV